MNNIEELKQKMLSLIEEDEEFAAYIGRTSRSITDYMLTEESDLDAKQRVNYALFFCVGASWAINDKKTKLVISQNNE